MREHKVYGLRVKGNINIRYIGITKRTLHRRLYHHLYECKKGLTYRKCNWIRSNNYNVEIFLIQDNLTIDEAKALEIKLISSIDNLTNTTAGGDLNPMDNPEIREKHRKIMGALDKEVFVRRGEDNWMTSKEGREWISEENKKRWESGIYTNEHNEKAKKLLEYDEVFKLYITQDKSLTETAELLNTTYRSLTRNLSRLGIRKYKKNK